MDSVYGLIPPGGVILSLSLDRLNLGLQKMIRNIIRSKCEDILCIWFAVELSFLAACTVFTPQ